MFQSLRVLQEGEADENTNRNAANFTSTTHNTLKIFENENYLFLGMEDTNNVCLKTGWFSALLALGGGTMCLLGGALLATCNRLRKQTIDKVLANNQFDGYMNHKGRIN